MAVDIVSCLLDKLISVDLWIRKSHFSPKLLVVHHYLLVTRTKCCPDALCPGRQPYLILETSIVNFDDSFEELSPFSVYIESIARRYFIFMLFCWIG